MEKRVFVVEYQTKEKGAKKRGLAVGDDTGDVDVILNEKGKVVEKIWDYRWDITYGINVFSFPHAVLKSKRKESV